MRIYQIAIKEHPKKQELVDYLDNLTGIMAVSPNEPKLDREYMSGITGVFIGTAKETRSKFWD